MMSRIIRIVVVLPAPLVPRKPKMRPGLTEKLTSSTAWNDPNVFDTFVISSAIDTPTPHFLPVPGRFYRRPAWSRSMTHAQKHAANTFQTQYPEGSRLAYAPRVVSPPSVTNGDQIMTTSLTKTVPATHSYGSWPSPVTTTMLTASPPGVREPGSNGRDLLWIETRPQERGRYVLVVQTTHGPQDVTPEPFNVRSRVHEYGGAAWAADGDLIVFSNFSDNRLYRIDGIGAVPRPITPEGDYRYADFQLDRQHNRIVAVREDHTSRDHEPVNTLVVLDLDGPNHDGGEVIVSGSDFVSSLRLNRAANKLAWLTWNHPNMPWDATLLSRATLTPEGTLSDIQIVAGGPQESVILPGWDNLDRLLFVSDQSGWWHLYRNDGTSESVQLTTGEREFGVPLWQFGASTWTELADGTIVIAWTQGGTWHLGSLNPETRDLAPIALPFTAISEIRGHPDGRGVVLKAGSPTEPSALIVLDPESGSYESLKSASDVPLDSGYLSIAEPVSWTTPDGVIAYGFYYPPVNKDAKPPENELPPLIVESHGGPTGATSDTYSLQIQFWTSRGFAILDVNYGGSTGYGRAYRERLNGAWGVVDVDDCISGALSLIDRGLVDRDRLIIRGGSAGGFTTLAALAFRDVFAAGSSYYGIGDLEAMALDTHKFESRYLDTLVGPYPAAIDVYRERSAIHHVDKLSSAMILFQGLDDKVVPPNQSVTMADAVRARGLPVALLTFEGEGHGFRMADTIRQALEAELSFYGQVFGFEPADDIPRLKIDNL